jgi:hypothetical protein
MGMAYIGEIGDKGMENVLVDSKLAVYAFWMTLDEFEHPSCTR